MLSSLLSVPEPIPEVPEPIADQPEVVKEKEEKIIDCPDCDPPTGETDLAVRPHLLLTTQWAFLKQR